jgi:hypothetical protein
MQLALPAAQSRKKTQDDSPLQTTFGCVMIYIDIMHARRADRRSYSEQIHLFTVKDFICPVFFYAIRPRSFSSGGVYGKETSEKNRRRLLAGNSTCMRHGAIAFLNEVDGDIPWQGVG